MPKPHSENAYAPMCTPTKGAPWFALAFIRDARQNARADFIRDVSGNGRGWRALQAQGWRIVRVKVVAQ